jgi:hypothetical protein
MEAWMAEQEEVRCSCQHQAKDADESFAADSARAKSMAVRLKAAVLRTMIRGRAGHVRGFCATGQGGGIDNSCGKEGGGGGGGGDGDGGGGGAGGGDGGSGSGKGPGGLQEPKKKHDVKLPSKKTKLKIDESVAAMKQMGYKVDVGAGKTQKVGKDFVTTYKVTDGTGHSAFITAGQMKDLVYDNQK